MTPIKILFVEDESAVVDGFKTYLDTLPVDPGIQVYATEDGRTALELLGEKPDYYNLVILDWTMEGEPKGATFIDELRQFSPLMPIIVTTGKAFEAGATAVLKDAYRYFSKPFDPDELIAAILDISQQEAVFHHAAARAKELMSASQCLVWRYHRRRSELTLAGWADSSGLSKADRKTIIDAKANAPIQSILHQEAPTFIEDLSVVVDGYPAKFASARRWKALVCVPLIYQKQVVGLLESYYENGDRFKTNDWINNVRDMAWMFASQFAESIYNADFLRKSEELNRFSNVLAGHHKLTTLVDVIIKKAVHLVDADHGWFYLRNFEKNH